MMSSTNGKPVADVTVVIPFYNGHQFIQRALDSVTGQTVLPKRVIVVDDGSQQAFELPASYQLDGTEVVVIRHDENRGIPAARNTGIKAAQSEWIAFLDQDDEWVEDKLERQMSYISELGWKRAGFFGLMRVAETGRAVPSPENVRWLASERAPDELVERLLREGNFVPWGTMLVHRSLFESLGALDERLAHGSDDYEFVLRLAAAGQLFWGQPHHAPLLIRHEHGGNFSRTDRFFADATRISASWLESEKTRIRIAARRALGRQWFALARYQHRQGDFRASLKGYRKSMVLGTGSVRAKALAGLLMAVARVRR